MSELESRVRVTRIDLDGDMPTEVTMVLPVGVLARLTVLLGKIPQTDQPQGHALAVGEFYEASTGLVFNRFWSDGVDGFFTDGDRIGRL